MTHLESYSFAISIEDIVKHLIKSALSELLPDLNTGDINLKWGRDRPNMETDSGNPTHGSFYIDGEDLKIQLLMTLDKEQRAKVDEILTECFDLSEPDEEPENEES